MIDREVMAKKIKDRINEICTGFSFDYKGRRWFIDPYSRSDFAMWECDNDSDEAYIRVDSIDKVMDTPFFDGKSLNEIANVIKNIDGL